MELKTKVYAENDQQEIKIIRTFDLPVNLLYQAHIDAQIVEQWMGTIVLKLESRKHGAWVFETTDPAGNKHGFHGVIHDIIPNKLITRTFEMTNASFGPQLEFLEFHELSDTSSKLVMHVIYRSIEIRDQILKLPFEQGINMAHNKLELVMNN